MNKWEKIFNFIDSYIKDKDFKNAKYLLETSKIEAYEDFIDPRFLMKELRSREVLIQNL